MNTAEVESLKRALATLTEKVSLLTEAIGTAAKVEKELRGSYSAPEIRPSLADLEEKDSPTGSISLGGSKDDVDLEWLSKHCIFVSVDNQVRLNVGGHVFSTSVTTLLRDRRSLFGAMFSGKFPLERDSSGAYFIDRDPKHFRHVLNFLRDGKAYLNIIKLSDEEIAEVTAEARYYQLQELLRELKNYKQNRHAHKKTELTQEKEYRLFSDVPFSELSELFRKMTIDDSFDFEGWMKVASTRAHVLFSKKLSKGELALLDRLVSN